MVWNCVARFSCNQWCPSGRNSFPIFIFSPSSIGLRALITVCEEYAVSHDMLFNHKKSVILICRSKYMKNVYPVFTLNGKIVDESDTARYFRSYNM